MTKVEAPRVVEKQVPILTPQEIHELNHATQEYRGGNCAAAVGIMLYIGIRPHEVARLSWAQVDLQERAIYFGFVKSARSIGASSHDGDAMISQ